MDTVARRQTLQSLLIACAALAAAAAGGCAQDGGASLAPTVGRKAPDTFVVGKPYQLTTEELSLDCKKITGRMQVRILQVRDAEVRGTGSKIAQSTQAVVTPIFGGATRGADAAYDNARDRAYLVALNKRLAEKNCATFDLDAELQPRSMRDTPTPVPKKS